MNAAIRIVLVLGTMFATACAVEDPGEVGESTVEQLSEVKFGPGTFTPTDAPPPWLPKDTVCSMLNGKEVVPVTPGCVITIENKNCRWNSTLAKCQCDVTIRTEGPDC